MTITATLSEDPSADVTIPLTIPAPGGGEYTVPTNAEITITGAGPIRKARWRFRRMKIQTGIMRRSRWSLTRTTRTGRPPITQEPRRRWRSRSLTMDAAVEVTFERSGQYLDEGGTAPTFKVWLTGQPSADVTVTMSLRDRNTVTLSLSPAGPLTFTTSAWAKGRCSDGDGVGPG